MGEQKRKLENKEEFIFQRENYKWMFIGIGFIALGFILMIGGGSDDPNVFNEEIYSWRRIRLAPALILIGFAIEVYAILLKPNTISQDAMEGLNEKQFIKSSRKSTFNEKYKKS